jgi:hypothetical protein
MPASVVTSITSLFEISTFRFRYCGLRVQYTLASTIPKISGIASLLSWSPHIYRLGTAITRMKALSTSSSNREARIKKHTNMPLKGTSNKDSKNRPRNEQDDAYVHTPWLALITERQYASAEQR